MSVDGTVTGNQPYGLFVRLPALGPRVDGLLPAPETGEPRGTDLKAKYPPGTPIKAEILTIDERGRIRLTLRSREEREEAGEAGDFRRGASSSRADGPRSDGPRDSRSRDPRPRSSERGERSGGGDRRERHEDRSPPPAPAQSGGGGIGGFFADKLREALRKAQDKRR